MKKITNSHMHAINKYDNIWSIFVNNVQYIQTILVCCSLKISSHMYCWSLMTTDICSHSYFSLTSCVNSGSLVRFFEPGFPI